ncbi:hypothetical protein B0H10DRAFT_2227270 [Mycena sp. CBHHK59/15]|nr:hypothetical protein B0H10DRAFT_2227270 [Mycena sp. CBHHK59/15]
MLANKRCGFQFPHESENYRSAGPRSSVGYPVQTSSCVGTASRLACVFSTQTCPTATAAAAPQSGRPILAVVWMANNQRAKKVTLAPPEGGYVWLDQADNDLKLTDVHIKAPTQFETYTGNRWRAVTWDTPIPVASGRGLLLRAQGVTVMENWDMMQAFTQEL